MVQEVNVVAPLFIKEKTGETEEPQMFEGTLVILAAEASN
jgi:hypothetical protein